MINQVNKGVKGFLVTWSYEAALERVEGQRFMRHRERGGGERKAWWECGFKDGWEAAMREIATKEGTTKTGDRSE